MSQFQNTQIIVQCGVIVTLMNFKGNNIPYLQEKKICKSYKVILNQGLLRTVQVKILKYHIYSHTAGVVTID